MVQTLRRFFARYIWLLLGLLLFAWVMREIEWEPTRRALSRLRLWQIGLLIFINGFVLISLYGRWWVILRGMGVDIPLRAVARYTLGGFAISFLTPGPQFGGEPYQISALKRWHGVPLALSTGSVAIEKMIGLFTDILFLGVGLLLLSQAGSLRLRQELTISQIGVMTLLSFIFASIFLSLIYFWRRHRLPLTGASGRFLSMNRPWSQRFLNSVQQMEAKIVDLCHHRPQALLISLLFSILSWLFFGIEFLLTAAFIGIPLTPWMGIALLCAFRLAFLLPVPGGIGTVEASQLWVLSAFAVPDATSLAISFSLLIHLRDLIVVAAGLSVMSRNPKD